MNGTPDTSTDTTDEIVGWDAVETDASEYQYPQTERRATGPTTRTVTFDRKALADRGVESVFVDDDGNVEVAFKTRPRPAEAAENALHKAYVEAYGEPAAVAAMAAAYRVIETQEIAAILLHAAR